MMRRNITYLWFLLFNIIVLPLSARDSYPGNKLFSRLGITDLHDTIQSHKTGIYAAPIVFYSPDTRWGAGISAASIFHLKDKENAGCFTRASYVRLTAHYTQQKQKDLWAEWNVFTQGEKYFLKGEFRARNFPDRFYGLGNKSRKRDSEIYAYHMYTIKALFLKKVNRFTFVGIDLHFNDFYKIKREKGKILDTKSITGFNGGIATALGFVAIIDQRDNVMNPFRGNYLELSTYFYRKYLGSTFQFTVINGEYRRYWQIKRKHILAFQTKMRFALGSVPFIEMSQMGNDDMLRGYPRNRFRDRHMMGTQLEYRFPVFWRIGLATFAGLGEVFSNTNDIRFSGMKYTVGMGARFMMNAAERLNARLDYGYGSEGGYFYLAFTEAF